MNAGGSHTLSLSKSSRSSSSQRMVDAQSESHARLKKLLSSKHALDLELPAGERVYYPGKRAFAVVVCKTQALAKVINTRRHDDKMPQVPHIRWALDGLKLHTGPPDATVEGACPRQTPRHGTRRYETVETLRHGTTRYDTVRRGTTRYDAIRYEMRW